MKTKRLSVEQITSVLYCVLRHQQFGCEPV
jgi:hypothetical protein